MSIHPINGTGAHGFGTKVGQEMSSTQTCGPELSPNSPHLSTGGGRLIALLSPTEQQSEDTCSTPWGGVGEVGWRGGGERLNYSHAYRHKLIN